MVEEKIDVINENERLISGWLTVECVDRQGDIIPISEIKRAMLKYIDRGGHIIYGHSNKPIGKVLQWEIEKHPVANSYGIKFVAKIFKDYELDDIVWGKIKEGKLKGFSIGATAKSCDVAVVKDEKDSTFREARVLKGIELFEVSAVDEPANQYARLEEVSAIAKRQDWEEELKKKREKIEKGIEEVKEATEKAIINVEKPFAGFKDWNDCISKLTAKGYSEESAKRICGKLKHEYEKEFVIETIKKTFTPAEISYLTSLRAKLILEKASRPPKEWWDYCYKKIKERNPSYTDEQARAVCGSMYHHGWGIGTDTGRERHGG